MRIIALEEHFATPSIFAAWRALPERFQDLALANTSADVERRLDDLADERIGLMDRMGVDVQVLSVTAPGMQDLAPDVAVPLARETNDLLARTVLDRPDRFQGLATLATPAPEHAARELERAVTRLGLNGGMLFGRTRERNLDHPDFLPIFEAAAALRAPLYLHPQTPREGVREAYYSSFDDKVNVNLSTAGIGWHYETGMQLLRLVMSGVFDRFPDLQIVVGHWGEVVLFYLDRVDMLLSKAVKLQRPISEYFSTNVLVGPSGIWSQRYLQWAIEVLGIERIVFSTDYPYGVDLDTGARAFLEGTALNEGDRHLIAHGNWERTCPARRR